MEKTSSAIGIYLGMAYSCVATVSHDHVEVICNEQGNRTTPSFVTFTGSSRLVGEAARNLRAIEPLNTIFGNLLVIAFISVFCFPQFQSPDIMRFIGRKFDDKSLQSEIQSWPFRVVEGTKGQATIVVEYKGYVRRFSPVEILSMIISKMRKIAERWLGNTVQSAVLTVPADFNYSQRDAIKEAARLAGLRVLQLINEPVAAAIAYGFDEPNYRYWKQKKKNALVFDLSSCTLDVTVVSMQDEILKAKATTGDARLGGDEFTARMVDYFVLDLKRRQKTDITSDAQAIRRLRTACEQAMRELSTDIVAEITIERLHKSADFAQRITRSKFDELNKDMVDRCMETVEQCLRDSTTDKSEIEEVILVGGSSGIPRVHEKLKEYFNKESLCMSVAPEEVAAHGAAIQANRVFAANGEKTGDRVVGLDANPLSIGIETWCGAMTVVIPRGTSVPVTKELVVGVESQTSMEMRVFGGEGTKVCDNNLLGVLELDEINTIPRKITRVNVSFSIDVCGILTVQAKNERGRQKEQIMVALNNG